MYWNWGISPNRRSELPARSSFRLGLWTRPDALRERECSGMPLAQEATQPVSLSIMRLFPAWTFGAGRSAAADVTGEGPEKVPISERERLPRNGEPRAYGRCAIPSSTCNG